MTIPTNLAFDKVRVAWNSRAREITAFVLYDGDGIVHVAETIDVQHTKGDFNLLKARYISEQCHFEYTFSESGLGAFHEDYLPAPFQYAHDLNPIILQIRHENRLAAASVNPTTVFVWKRVASGTTPSAPTREFAGNIVALFDNLETDGWTIAQPSGTDPLWHVRVTYSYDHQSDTYETHYSTPETTAILYSTDGGLNYSATQPADTDDIDFVGYHTTGGWHYVPYVGSVPEPEDPDVVSPFRDFPNDFWQNNPSFPYRLDVSSIRWDEIYVFGFDAKEANGWGDTGTYRWRADPHKFTERLVWSYPADRDHGAGPFIQGSTYLLLIDRVTGKWSFDLAHNPTLDDYAGQGRWLIAFEYYPKTFFTHDITDSGTTVEINSNLGMEVGDILYANDEQMEITAIENIVRSLPTGVRYHQVTVTRGVNGTTAQAHSEDDTVRAIYNYDFPRYVSIVARSNVAHYTTMRPFYIVRRGVS